LYQASDDKYSSYASGWNLTGLPAIEKRSALAPNLIPWDGFHASALNFRKASSDLFLPCLFGVGVDGGIKTIDQAGGEFGALFFGKRQCLFK
jgi:hypothetical protein